MIKTAEFGIYVESAPLWSKGKIVAHETYYNIRQYERGRWVTTVYRTGTLQDALDRLSEELSQ